MLDERFEKFRCERFLKTYSRIAKRHSYSIISNGKIQIHATAGRSELDCVRYEIIDNLSQTNAAAVDDARVFRELRYQPQPCLQGRWLLLIDRLC